MTPARILIVEDEFILANDIETRLLDFGYNVVGKAASGPVAIELAGSMQPDLVLMDIRLQGSMDGIAAALEIRQRFHLPVVFLTAFAEDSTLQRAKEAEPFGYILKPFEDRELRTNIEIALYKHKAESEIRRLNRLYATLSQVNQCIVRVGRVEELFPKICQIALEFGQFKAAWIAMLDDASGALLAVAKAGVDAGIVVGEPISHCGCTLAAIQQGQPCLINDLRTDSRALCREQAGNVGLRACAAYPIRLQNQVCGVFVVGTAEASFFNDAETRLLDEIAMDISFALDRLEVERQRREAEEALKEREQHLETILQTAIEAFYLVDTQGKLLDVNDAYCVMSGYTREELLTMCIRDLECAESAQEVADHSQRIIRQGRDRFGSQHRRKDGQVIDVESSVAFQDIGGGQFVCFLRDVTDQKQAEQLLRESEERFRTMYEHAAVGIQQIANDGRLLMVNQAICRMLGYSESELIGRPVIELTHPDDLARNAALREPMLRGERDSYENEKRYLHRDGSPVWVHVTSSVVRGSSGHPLCRIAIVEDITERKRWEQEREITIEFLRLVNASTGTREMIQAATTFFQKQSGCEAVGIRLQEGDDYPYFEARGFPQEFVQAENTLCSRDDSGEVIRDNSGNPALDCMCGNVICGRFDPSEPFFTRHGSFWANDTTRLLATTTDADRQGCTRNRCNGEGYESVALIPLHVGEERFGLLQLNDRRKGQFSPEIISFWERLADQLAIALSKFRTEVALHQSELRYRSLFENMVEGLAYCKMLFDDHGSPVDFVYLDVNRAFQTLTGLTNVVGKKVTEVIPGIKESSPELFEVYGRVSLTGQPEKIEIEVPSLGIWFYISVYSSEREYFVAVFDNINKRKRAELELSESQDRLQVAIDAAKLGVWSRDLITGEMFWDDQTRAIYGAPPNAVITYEVLLSLIVPEDRELFTHSVPKQYQKQESNLTIEYRISWPDGTIRWLHVRGSTKRDGSGKPIRLAGVIMDITERKRSEQEVRALEEQLRQAQKMEAVGRLAGGIAHDNLLMVIRSYTEMLQDRLPAHDSLRKNAQEILKAADRAASLTGQMLAFSRKQVLSPIVLDLHALVSETAKMLKRLIGEDIELAISSVESLWSIRADPDQIVQVLMNLCVNARDAMPQGGTLTIATGNGMAGEGGLEGRAYVAPGDYVMLSVTDTGTGISQDVQEQMFEPFFTTKERDKGTGLGLSTVYGIVKQSGGYIWVDSELGRGACFTIYLPAEKDAVASAPSANVVQHQGGPETLLVVEDEEALREAIVDFLDSLGYTVLAADSGQQALSAVSEHDGPIDLLITDVVMPKMSGRELSQMLGSLRPDMKTIYMSGYTDDAMVRHGVSEVGVAFLQKPFSLSTLARKVRETIGSAETLQ